jgi:hypothetical protein
MEQKKWACAGIGWENFAHLTSWNRIIERGRPDGPPAGHRGGKR